MESVAQAALVLFDIDGTLIRRAGPHHRQALVEAVRSVTGLETTTDSIPMQGMLDPDILATMMRNAGASPSLIRRRMPEIVKRAQSVYTRHSIPLKRKVCPGARGALWRLKRREVLLGLVTGNITGIGWKKMELSGLKSYFRFGMFGEMARDRSLLAKMAIRRARESNWIEPSAQISLVGDAPADIQAARANGVRSIAVATGLSTADELASYDPDILLADLRELKPEMVL
jgi:phosphoglycolate phosphatase-like HAD superfamily hydrolase